MTPLTNTTLTVRLTVALLLLHLAGQAFAINPPSPITAPPTSMTGSYEVTWPAVSGATGYAIYESINYGSYSLIQFNGTLKYSAIGRGVGNYIYVVAACSPTTCSTTSPPRIVTVNALQGPTTDVDGDYTIRWTEEPGATKYPVYTSINAGPYQLVQFNSMTYYTASRKSNNTYFYTVGACDATTCDASTSPVKALSVTGNSTQRAAPLNEQLLYQYEVRVGDFNSDGKNDVLLDRVTPSAQVDGTMQPVILYQGAGNTLQPQVPTASQLTTARSYPLNSGIAVGLTDMNFDLFADVMLKGLAPYLGPNMIDQVVFAPALWGSHLPLAARAIDQNLMRFFHDLASQLNEPSYFARNLGTTIVPIFGFSMSCTFNFENFAAGCYPVPTLSGFTVQLNPGFTWAAFNVWAQMQTMKTAGTYSDSEMWALSQLFSQVLGVQAFGFRPDGTRPLGNLYDFGGPQMNALVSDHLLQYLVEIIRRSEWWQAYSLPGQAHYYETKETLDPNIKGSKICRLSEANCTAGNVFCWVKRYPAPREDILEDWTVDPDIDEMLMGENQVAVEIDEANHCITNTTLPKHRYHDPGNPTASTVERCVVTKQFQGEQWIFVETTGSGTGPYKPENEILGPSIFKGLDIVIATRRAYAPSPCQNKPRP